MLGESGVVAVRSLQVSVSEVLLAFLNGPTPELLCFLRSRHACAGGTTQSAVTAREPAEYEDLYPSDASGTSKAFAP